MRLRRSFLTLMHILVFVLGTDAMTMQSHAGAYPVAYKTPRWLASRCSIGRQDRKKRL
jgi:hypothetical protein